MLETIRDRFRGPIAIAIIVAIGIPLAITFGQMDITNTGTRYAARVNGEDIDRTDFDRAYQDERLARQQALRAELTPEMEEQLKRGVLEQLVVNRSITQFVKDAGFRVGDARVAEHIRQLPIFQVAGAFSKASYDAALAGQGLSPAAFEEEQRTVLSLQQLQDGLVQSGFYTPAEYRRFIALEMERRDVIYATADVATLAGDVTVDDAEIQAFYEANKARFQTPEQADIEYVELTSTGLAQDYQPDEAALQKAYDTAEPGRFRSDEERHARHILISVNDSRSEAEARRIADQVEAELRGGADFAALAARYSDDTGSKGQGGDLGWAGKGVYAPEFEQALYALKPSEVSAPVRTPFGFHVIRLDEVRAGSERTFDQVRDELVAELRQQKAQDEYYAVAEQLDDLALENPNSLEPVAKATGLPLKRIDGYTRQGGGPFGDNQNLVGAIFSDAVLEGGENTPLVELGDGRAVVARVIEFREPAPVPLEKLREQIAGQVRAEKLVTVAREKGEALMARVRNGEPLAGIARSAGFQVTGPLTLGRQAATVPPELMTAMFRAPKPEPGKTVVEGVVLSTGYGIFELRRVEPGQPDQVPREVRDQRKRLLAQQSGLAETRAMAESVRASADVTVAADLFKPEDEDL